MSSTPASGRRWLLNPRAAPAGLASIASVTRGSIRADLGTGSQVRASRRRSETAGPARGCGREAQ